jgi:hypothetical protein
VDDLDFDPHLPGANGDVGVGGGAIHVAHDEKRYLLRLGHLEHGVALLLDCLAVRERDLAPVKGLHSLLVDAKDGRVRLEEDGFATLHRL